MFAVPVGGTISPFSSRGGRSGPDLARPPARCVDGLARAHGLRTDSAERGQRRAATPSSKASGFARASTGCRAERWSSKRATSWRARRGERFRLSGPRMTVEERFVSPTLGDDRTELRVVRCDLEPELMRSSASLPSPTNARDDSRKAPVARWAAAFPRTARCGPAVEDRD